VITTVAGGGTQSGENIPATSAYLVAPIGVAVDAAGNLYITESQGSGYANLWVGQTERYLGTKQDLVHAPNDAIKLKVAM
jgi:sugar lactone lactonase YvrE